MFFLLRDPHNSAQRLDIISSSRVVCGGFPRLILSRRTDVFWSLSMLNREFIIHWKSPFSAIQSILHSRKAGFPVTVCVAALSRCRWTHKMSWVSRSYCSSSKKTTHSS